MAVDLGSLACAWSVVTLPRPAGAPEPSVPAPLALGARWLAYEANQVRALPCLPVCQRPRRARRRRGAQRPRARRCLGRLSLLCTRVARGERALCRVCTQSRIHRSRRSGRSVAVSIAESGCATGSAPAPGRASLTGWGQGRFSDASAWSWPRRPCRAWRAACCRRRWQRRAAAGAAAAAAAPGARPWRPTSAPTRPRPRPWARPRGAPRGAGGAPPPSGGRQLRVLGEAGYKAVSARVGAWRGAAAGGLARCAPGARRGALAHVERRPARSPPCEDAGLPLDVKEVRALLQGPRQAARTGRGTARGCAGRARPCRAGSALLVTRRRAQGLAARGGRGRGRRGGHGDGARRGQPRRGGALPRACSAVGAAGLGRLRVAAHHRVSARAQHQRVPGARPRLH